MLPRLEVATGVPGKCIPPSPEAPDLLLLAQVAFPVKKSCWVFFLPTNHKQRRNAAATSARGWQPTRRGPAVTASFPSAAEWGVAVCLVPCTLQAPLSCPVNDKSQPGNF